MEYVRNGVVHYNVLTEGISHANTILKPISTTINSDVKGM